MNKCLRNLLYGFLIWLIPFLTSFFFYTREGELIVDIFLFKSIMIVVGSVSSAFFIVAYFKRIHSYFVREGLIIGFSWFGINILLDLLILIPMSGMSVSDYFIQIGIRYLVIPAICLTVGIAVTNRG